MAFITVNNMRSSNLERKVPFNVSIPFDSKLFPHPKGEKFKTLYLLHGLRDNMYTWPLHTRIAELSEKYNIAVIMPSGENSYYMDRDDYFQSYGKFVKELVDRTRVLFPLSEEKEDTFIGGFSMGGYGALHNGLVYNDTFSKMVVFSPSLELTSKADQATYEDPFPMNKGYIESHYGDLETAKVSNKNPFWLIDKMKEKKADFPKIFMRTGSSDPISKVHKMLVEKYEEAGIDYTEQIVEGAHEWDFINRNLEDAIKWLVEEK